MSERIAQIAKQAVDLLIQKELQIATAESCTAGLLSAAITSISGASAVFGCGVAAYAPETKRDLLGVPEAILKEHGTVSSKTAAAMASGVRLLSGADIGVSITGVAGPQPSEGKPVGTVHIALANEQRVWLRQLWPNDTLCDREAIRSAAVLTALEMILEYAQAYPVLTAGSVPLSLASADEVVIPETPAVNERRFLSTVLPWRGDTARERIVKLGAIVVVISLFISGTLFANRLLNENDNRSLYSDLQNMYTDEQSSTVDESNDILPRFSSLYLQNADIGGWIRINDTAINYPVMKNAGSDYYATHNFRQQTSSYGVPYFDSHNSLISPEEENKALIVYGNNTGDGQMFSQMTAYRDAEFFKQHMTVELSTLYASNRWVLFGVMVLDPEEINAFKYAKTTFKNDNAFLEHVAAIRSRSLLDTDIDVNAKDELILFVTQAQKEYGFESAVMVVVGRRLRDGETPLAIEDVEVSVNETVIMPRAWVHMNRGSSTAKRTTATTQSSMPSATDSGTITSTTSPALDEPLQE